ncbi:MAG: AcvB/VirJ family lysyl-phosphatidylglycerol hydrolase [Flavisolibacter sp.]
MIKVIACFLLIITVDANAQELPVTAYNSSDTTKPIVLYISGDGGLSNSFSKLLKKMNGLGYPIIGLNAQSYFWKRKRPQRVTEDFTRLLSYYINKWHRSSYALVGYSFGADVIPFFQNSLSPEFAALNKQTILMSPSKRTDFEIHILGMIGCEIKEGLSIPKEINRMTGPVTVFFGTAEHRFPMNEITSSNIHIAFFPGGHHYRSDVDQVVSCITDTIR